VSRPWTGFALVCLFLALPARADRFSRADLIPRQASLDAVRADLASILSEAHAPAGSIRVDRVPWSGGATQAFIRCGTPGVLAVEVTATDAEWAPTFYHALRKLGFLFPHPRMQLSPNGDLSSYCGRSFTWLPRVAFRGFHLHTEHPNEWVHGFLEGDRAIAEALVRWLARNGQNALEVVLLGTVGVDKLRASLAPAFQLAQNLGVTVGPSVSFALAQQKSYRLLDPLAATVGIGERASIDRRIDELSQAFPMDFLAADLGTTEFTSNGFSRTLGWIEMARAKLAEKDRKLFTKVHVSINQTSAKYGNYNFLPQYSDPGVGIFPHTVMFYGLEDSNTPVYGRKDFQDLIAFIRKEKTVRDTWFFPETSYWVGMDMDIPLFLTDYLVARSNDFDFVENEGLQGIITFTSGQELGYWLMDWTTALLADAENRGDPLVGLKLLGEDPVAWQRILDFQTRWFKDRQLIQELSSSNLMDEIPFLGRIHERKLLRELEADPALARQEMDTLAGALMERPSLDAVVNPELKALLEVTWLRVEHAYWLRKALSEKHGRRETVQNATQARLLAQAILDEVTDNYSRYPEARVFSRHPSPTSYSFGYLWPAATLHWWEREERMVADRNYNPFFMNIYNPVQLLF
jgi:hypothetical protein